MTATTSPLLALTASDLMSRDLLTIPQDSSLRTAAELFVQKQVEEAPVVDADGRCIGMLSASDFVRGVKEGPPDAEDVPPPGCPYQVKGRLQGGAEVVICMLAEGRCPLQVPQATKGGRHTAVCRLPDGVVSDWQQVTRSVPASTVRRCMTPDVATVAAEVPLSVLARTMIDARIDRLVVVDKHHRPIGIVSCLDVLAALADPVRFAAGG